MPQNPSLKRQIKYEVTGFILGAAPVIVYLYVSGAFYFLFVEGEKGGLELIFSLVPAIIMSLVFSFVGKINSWHSREKALRFVLYAYLGLILLSVGLIFLVFYAIAD